MGKGKGIPDHFEVDADIDTTMTSTSDMVSDSTLHFPDVMRTAMTTDATMRFPDVMRTAMSTDSTMHFPDPMRTEMAITEPIRTEMQMDVKPVVVDLCLNVGINKLPRTCVKRPYHHRLSLTLMGNEVASVAFAGSREVIIDDLDQRPSVAWGTDHGVRNPHPPAPTPEPGGGLPPARPASAPARTGAGGGLRINLGD